MKIYKVRRKEMVGVWTNVNLGKMIGELDENDFIIMIPKGKELHFKNYTKILCKFGVGYVWYSSIICIET